MSISKALRYKLFSPEEILTVSSRLSGGKEVSHEAMKDIHTAEKVVLHRSIYRDYFSIALKYVFLPSFGPNEEFRNSELIEFVKLFSSGRYDFVNLEPVNIIAEERGWINPFGWDSDAGIITKPLTNLFCSSASLSIRLKFFHASAVSTQIDLNDFERFIIKYVDDALMFDKDVLQAEAPPVYDAIIQSQAQLAQYAIRIRAEFEDSQERIMSRQDWNYISPSLSRLFLKEATKSRVDSFKGDLNVLWGPKPFSFRSTKNQDSFELIENEASNGVVDRLIDKTEQREYVDFHSNQPVTGCPVLHSRIGNPEIGHSPSFLTLVVESLQKSIADDFWPVSDSKETEICPYSNAPT